MKKIFIILENRELLGVFSTLRLLCEDLKKKDVNFPSYWTIARDNGEIKEKTGLEIQNTNYVIYSAEIEKKDGIGKRGNPNILRNDEKQNDDSN